MENTMTSINTNLSALNAQFNLQKQAKEMDQSMARLASGLRINSAADDVTNVPASFNPPFAKSLKKYRRYFIDNEDVIDNYIEIHEL